MLTERRVDDLIAAGQMRSPAEHLTTWNGLQLSEAHSSVKWMSPFSRKLEAPWEGEGKRNFPRGGDVPWITVLS
jgi:hypothetical protein